MKSCTRVCAPKPMARPAIPALASNGPMLMPSSGRICIAAMKRMTNSPRCKPRWKLCAIAVRAPPTEDPARLPSSEMTLRHDLQQSGKNEGNDEDADNSRYLMSQKVEGVVAPAVQHLQGAVLGSLG